MHPAYSVIFFTVASGAGYGLLFLLALLALAGGLPEDLWFGGTALILALALVGAGLLSSTFHLGRPERAWRAFSQWRSSWLSREGVLAVASYPSALLFGGSWAVGAPWHLAASVTAALAVATVAATAMIYASLKPVRQWHNHWVPMAYLSLALMSGALWFQFLASAFGLRLPVIDVLAPAAILVGFAVKRSYWHWIDGTDAASSPETATGLGHLGAVRVLDPPHTGPNFLQKEMGYRVARKHATKLRRVAQAAGFLGPFAACALVPFLPTRLGAFISGIAVASVMLGLLVERWLFFAEAKHTITLYYGAEKV